MIMSTAIQKAVYNGVELEIQELKPGFGAQVLNVDIPKADDSTRAALVETFHRHGALLLRNQEMDPLDLESFLGMFGGLEGHTLKENCLDGHPNIYILSNRIVDGKPIGAHNDGVGWHTDYSYKEEPVMCTMLYAKEVPEVGSDTLVADCCAAYEALTDERKKQLDDLVLHHSYKYFMETREFNRQTLSKELEEENPDVRHPLIRTHPADGRKALWVSTGTVKNVVGMSNPEGLDLIDELVEFVTQDQFVYRHKWQVGDIMIWDNRCTLHTGTLYNDKEYIRQMYRMWVKGDKPF
jgi:alpha-ketoglutarate-dependent taurine dioxygenase